MLFLLFAQLLFSQQDICINRGDLIIIPVSGNNLTSKKRGLQFNNMIMLFGGRVIVLTAEVGQTNSDFVYGYYSISTDNEGVI